MAVPQFILNKINNIFSNIVKTSNLCITNDIDNSIEIYYENDKKELCIIKITIKRIKYLDGNYYNFDTYFYENNELKSTQRGLNYNEELSFIRAKQIKNITNSCLLYNKHNNISQKKINNKQNIEYICKNTKKYTQQTSNNGFKITKIKKLFNNNWYLTQLINTDMSSFAYYTRFFNHYVFNCYIYCLKSIFKDNYTDEFYKISDTKKTYYRAFFINII